MNEVSTNPSSSTATIETLPAVECAPWCVDGTGHTYAWHPDDQRCRSEVSIVRLSRMPLVSFEGEQWMDNIQVYLARDREGLPHVMIYRDESVDVQVALGEAQELIDAWPRPGSRGGSRRLSLT